MDAATCTATTSAPASVTTCPAALQVASGGCSAAIGTVRAIAESFLSFRTRRIGQACYCVLAHYYAGPVLDDQVLLAGAFAGFTQELDRLGLDQPDATMPALTGHRGQDWAAFAAVYQSETAAPPSS